MRTTDAKSEPVIERPVNELIVECRGQKVILDSDLAALYGVPTKVFNQAVKRNAERFPSDFVFELTLEEAEAVRRSRSQNVTLKRGQNLKYRPKAFTEHGAIMAATILNSAEAVRMSVYVVRAFVQMREQITANREILNRLAEIDKTLLHHDKALQVLWSHLQPLLAPPPTKPKRRIGFEPDDQ
jgi:hypothetical protein